MSWHTGAYVTGKRVHAFLQGASKTTLIALPFFFIHILLYRGRSFRNKGTTYIERHLFSNMNIQWKYASEPVCCCTVYTRIFASDLVLSFWNRFHYWVGSFMSHCWIMKLISVCFSAKPVLLSRVCAIGRFPIEIETTYLTYLGWYFDRKSTY